MVGGVCGEWCLWWVVFVVGGVCGGWCLWWVVFVVGGVYCAE